MQDSHYENFPVASWLCPAALRAPISAIYHFARTADDLADEGVDSAQQRLHSLAQYREDLLAIASQQPHSGRWPGVFDPLARQMQVHQLPVQLLDKLLSAFLQDVTRTRDGTCYQDQAELLGYCEHSANPVGRLLLHLYGVQDAPALQHSDAICSALQLINFWQDLGRDIPRQRHYLPRQDCDRFGIDRAALEQCQDSAATAALIEHLCQQARALMLCGAPLVHRLPGRAGWELRLVVQGGLRVLDKIEYLGWRTLSQRPVIHKGDYAIMLWRALQM